MKPKALKIALLLIPFCIITSRGFSQDFNPEEYNWEKTPSYIKTINKNESHSYIFNKRIIEYARDSETRNLFTYTTVHYKIKLNTDDAISKVNKVYVSLKNVVKIIEIKARAITKENKIIEVDKNNIKQVKNIEDKGAYKLFAIEGVEPESVIEVLYILKKKLYLYGSLSMQFSVSSKKNSLEIISPQYLIFKAKCYNGTPTQIDTVINKKRHLKFILDSVSSVNNEKYTSGSAKDIRVDYKFYRNTNKSNSGIYTYAKAASTIYKNAYVKDSKIIKKLKKEINKLSINKKETEEKIRIIENYVKNNYIINEDVNSPDINKIDFILKNKYTTESGIVKLTANLLEISEIDHRLVITCNRTKRKPDKDFMMWYSLTKYLIYFPKFDKYMAPDETFYRYPMIPSDYFNNNALLLKKVSIGEHNTVVPKIIFIPPNDISYDYHKTEVELTVNYDFFSAELKIKESLAGLSSMYIYPYYNMLKDDIKKNLQKSLIENIVEDAEILEVSVNKINNDYPPVENPFVIKSKVNSSSVIEKAGRNYLIKIGKLIGPQVEMYDTTARVHPIEMPFVHTLERKITLNIPEGYIVKGLENAKINVEYGENNKKTMGFVSDYTVSDKKVIVTVYEYYKKLNYPVEKYKEFREVINAASDFNKIVFVLEKK